MLGKDNDSEYSENETVARREAVLKRMLSTPYKPHSESKLGKKRKPQKTAKPKR